VALVVAGLVARGVRIAAQLVERVAGAACVPEDERRNHGEDGKAGGLGNVLSHGRRPAAAGEAEGRKTASPVAGSGSTGPGSGPG
tara:strand:+ start:2647 stop:2901 length:255 start_codon:yes stop_codon:yes gene_type:complete